MSNQNPHAVKSAQRLFRQGKYFFARWLGRLHPRLPHIELPFNSQPAIRAYLYNAYMTGMLATNEEAKKWVWRHYLQPFFPLTKTTVEGAASHVCLVPEMTLWQCEQQKFIECSDWKDIGSMRSNPGLFIERILSSLARGKFVYLYVNEYFIPQTPSFLRQDFRHEILLIGADPEKKEFIAVGYLDTGEFDRIGVPLRALHLAAYCLRGYIPNRYCSVLLVREIRVNLYEQIKMTSDETLRLLQRYAASERQSDRDGWYGFAVYDGMFEYITFVQNSNVAIDLRATRLIYEHKQMLGLCLGSLERGNGSLNMYLEEEMEKLIHTIHKVHLTALAFNRQRNVKLLDKIRADLRDARCIEAGMLHKVCGT